MNLHRLLQDRVERAGPIRVGIIGAGKFATMFLAQARVTPGLHIMGIADLDPARGTVALNAAGWPAEAGTAASLADALGAGTTYLTDDAEVLIAADGMEVVVDATGSPTAGIRHARLATRHGRHMVMVNVEADVLAGPLLAAEARAAGLVYSLAYGDQPALICEMVDWARASGFDIVAAGKGTKYLPAYHASMPEMVWEHMGISAQEAAAAGMNAQMFNSFFDGTKSAIEMTAVANACDLRVPSDGLSFPPVGVDALPEALRPSAEGGLLEAMGQVEVVSCLERDGSPVERDLRWGVYVVFEAGGDYTARCFSEYGMATDASGRYSALYRPYHLIGLELGISVLSAVLRGEPTGQARDFRGDVVAVAKRALTAGERLDGEGGTTVWGKLLPAEKSLARRALPIGLAKDVALLRDVAEGEILSASDVRLSEDDPAIVVRREMEHRFAGPEASGG
jgi:predicted homoserine dehydrogenase-like protein